MNLKSCFQSIVLTAIGTLLAACLSVQAHPYASGVTNDNGTIRFILNEGGGTVEVVFEDNTTNSLGVLAKGPQSFPLGSHTSFSIYVTKSGTGTPALISTDTDQFAIWNSARGVDVNKSPKIGYLFGRTYVGNSAVGGTAPNNKQRGLYALNADMTDALGNGATALAQGTWVNSAANGPWRLRVAPDNTVLVSDFSAAAAALWQFHPDLTDSNLVLSIVGQTEAQTAGIHGNFFGTSLMTGSLAEGNLVLWTADSSMAVPSAAVAPNLVLGPGTSRGSFNCVFRYDIGSGPLPWNSPPNYAYTLGLDGIGSLRTEVEIGKDGKIIGGFGRANLSNGNIQILDPTGATKLYDSLQSQGNSADLWNGSLRNNQVGTYAGVRVSPDGRFLASVDINNGITIGTLTNGIPDEGSLFHITNSPNVGNSRGMGWDAANNIYVISSGQGLLRAYSLGLTTTCVTSNDFTGTNGSFQLVLPNVTATVVASTSAASQNYINSNPAGTPIPGVFTISLDKGQLSEPVTVNFTRSGTAVLTNNYNYNYGPDANGVVISANSVTFPAGNFPGGGNWSVNVQVIPTATPVSGPTLTAGLRLVGGANYLAGTPLSAAVTIANTGPQVLLLSAAATGTTMNRAIANDYARFVITRHGDTNGPGNSAGNVTPTSYTVTNFSYFGTAVFPTDYTARAQRTDPAGDGIVQVPVDGSPGLVINPGNITVTGVIGNPVPHSDLTARPTNVTIVINLTNAVSGTNVTSSEGFNYAVNTGAVTLTEIDNTVGPEVVLWSNPLTNSTDSTNWTLVFASTNLGAFTTLPVVIPNYTNSTPDLPNGANNFDVKFGHEVQNDSVPPSPVMAANGWTSALRMTVNKDPGFPAQSAVNLYPQGLDFKGNYALRFSMYLSLYSFAIDNPNAGTFPREFALFGINHYGTNANWRPAAPIPVGTGSSTTNADGVWFAIGADTGSITPADYDAFTSPALPNAGVAADLVSNTGASQSGVFKRPPFVGRTAAGGAPVNQWVDVSVEVTRQTNVTVLINRSQVLTSFSITNGGNYTNGTIMLGYLDPVFNVSDNSAFVYYSNVRVVELSPYILTQPGLTNSLANRLMVTQGSSLTFTSSATFASAPITNTWYRGTGTVTVNTGVPTVALQTNVVNDTSMTDTLTWTFNSPVDATNYMSVFSDFAGSVTSRVVAVEVVFGPTNQTAEVGSTFHFQVRPAGPIPPTLYQWRFNGTNLVNNTHYAGVTSSNLFITNIVAGDAGTYSVLVSNVAGTVMPSAVLTVGGGTGAPPTFSNLSLSNSDVVMAFNTTNPGDTIASFVLQSSPVVEGPYTNTPALFTGTGGVFQVTVPQGGSNMFYRLLRTD